jgi:shikimate dehydrogenase
MTAGPRLAGLIGHPVAHSISPAFQQAAFDALGIHATYERWDTPPDRLATRVRALRGARYFGANVTVPHKEAVLPLLDDLDPMARRAGAVNTIVNTNGRISGSNTDIVGFRRALREAGGFDAAGKRALVLGAGGAARAVILALEQEGAVSVAVANRHLARAERLVSDLRSNAGPGLIAIPWEQATSALTVASVDLLINCTTLGLAGSALARESPIPCEALHSDLYVCDIVANPLVTPLLHDASVAGAGCVGGLPMLVYGGAASFEQWTGETAPVDTMLHAASMAMR